MKQRQNVALVGGLLRDELEFRLTFARLLAARQDGSLSEIVLSTWEGEIDRYPGLRRELSAAGIHLVEGRMPPKSFGNTWAQMKALEQGLRAVPDGAAVWRLRTDRTSHLLKAFEPYLAAGPAPARPYGALAPVFEHKVAAPAVVASFPFFAADTAYYGMKTDLAKLVSYDGVFDAVFDGFGAEHRLWTQPFVTAHPSLRTVYEAVNIKGLSHQAVTAAEHDTPLPDPLLHLFVFYWAALSTSLQSIDRFDEADGGAISVRSVLGGTPSPVIRTGCVASQAFSVKVAVFNNQAAVDRLVGEALPGDTALDRRAAELLAGIRAGDLGAPDWDDAALEALADFQPDPAVPFLTEGSKVTMADGLLQPERYQQAFGAASWRMALADLAGLERISDAAFEFIAGRLDGLATGANSGMVYLDMAEHFLARSTVEEEARTLATMFLFRAARASMPEASAALGWMLYHGLIGPEQADAVLDTVRNAAIRDHGFAQHVYGLLLSRDVSRHEGETPDYWLGRARTAGFNTAQIKDLYRALVP